MTFLSSIAVKAALIAVGGIAFTMIATVTVIVLYYCTCHRKNKRLTKAQQERTSTELQDRPLRPLNTTHSTTQYNNDSSSLIQSGSSTEYHRRSVDTSSQLTVVSLATLESGALQGEEIESHLRTSPGRIGAPTNTTSNSELELSQRTWSAYESLPRGLTAFAGPKNEDVIDHNRSESVDRHQSVSEDIDTMHNDAYTSSQEILSIARNKQHSNSHTQQHCIIPTPLQRISTISNTSTGSGYVINSLHSPNDLHSPRKDRASCYSTVSEGYVIDYLEWTTTNRSQPRAILPSIAEDYDNTVQLDYLQIIH